MAVAFVVWLLVRGGDLRLGRDDDRRGDPGRRLTPERLRDLSVEDGQPIYWLGPQAGPHLRADADLGRQDLRALPAEGRAVGSGQAEFTLVGTYPVDDAYGVLKSCEEVGRELVLRAAGARRLQQRRPTNVYLAYPGSDVQIEVFDPSAEQAR